MLNRQFKIYEVEVQSDEFDLYGQQQKTYTYVKSIEVVITLLTQINTNDIRYKDCTHLGLTKDKSLTDSMRLKNGTIYYEIVMVNNDSKYTQLTLKEDKGV